MIRVSIIGASGYTGGELLRILLNHPECEVVHCFSLHNAGKAISAVHTDLLGDTSLCFSNTVYRDAEVYFLCMGHAKSREFIAEHSWLQEKYIIDLSNDFRLHSEDNDFVYGLPELHKQQIAQAKHVANPGCFATAIQLALLPLAQSKLLTNDIHVSAITGSTGAGQSLTDTVHFSWRTNNVQVYKAFQHQHVPEIVQSLQHAQPAWNNALRFIPYRGNFTRGILASCYTTCSLSQNELTELYHNYYHNQLFVHVVGEQPDIKQVVNTNKCFLHVEKHDDVVLITSVIDNLIKGASGQAVQNMNLMFGVAEQTGLSLKATAF
ncbi:MAG: N-acetyl-gamma-glutamyl-phosphate reductase [Candidatus Kapabacteria bacterium]|nr:N-acetyl-gamma-glutamyl-phosphate reductase [Candidatus Kapabacteria bacterium]